MMGWLDKLTRAANKVRMVQDAPVDSSWPVALRAGNGDNGSNQSPVRRGDKTCPAVGK